ncbi:helix-turn-helix domain-containing protein [Sphingomonas sp. VDB2]|uniref:helix-turn-helix domain-containing protein n=1 Tax=Sphingomonas sp. VDB2 TaxID=3228751 RepID=UPI003A7FA889
MSMQMTDMGWSLTEKEKQTLRLIVRGHDAKSIARSLGLSVHTINERLRDARRKMAVSSSREAARMLLEAEGGDPGTSPDYLGDREIGADALAAQADEDGAPTSGAGRTPRPFWIIIGVMLMTLVLGLLALAALPQLASAPSSQAPTATEAAPRTEVVDAARQWLVLGDQGRWEDGYRATGSSFRKANTPELWASVQDKVRTPLGALISRDLLSQEYLLAPPNGFEMVKFRTRFANKAEATESVTLEREDGIWRVVAVMIE